jgi:uncharacterized membrane protein YhaH (DUF805 family)
VGILSLLFGFQGRINRAQYWLGGMGAGVGIVVILTVLVILGGPVDPTLTEEQRMVHFVGSFMLALIPAMLVGSWIGYALAWKRFHDRGKSGVWVFLPFLPAFMLMSSVFGAVASGGDPMQVAASTQPWSAILWLIQLWYFVELGCMPGKEGPNKYGNPPGNGSAAPVPGTPSKSADMPIPGMKSALVGAETAMERAIAARSQPQRASTQHGAAPAAAAPVGGLRPATAGSFGRRVTR